MQALHTTRLVLEPQTVAHAAEMFRLLCDPALYEYENEAPASEQALADRFARLQSRRSPDGREHWLNWVVRLRADGALIGYVQATVHAAVHATDTADCRALVAYVFGSGYWGRGLAGEAVQAMLGELAGRWQVSQALAVLKRRNRRSLALLARAGFDDASPADLARLDIDADECLKVLPLPR